MKILTDFDGANIIVLEETQNSYVIEPDMRDTNCDWFYWAFGAEGEKGETVCFLASSLEMNYHTLLNAEVSLSAPRKSKIERQSYYLPISDVDNRDGLMTSLFECDYVLVPSKLQLHLSPEEQEVISVPYNLIINGEGIGEAYEKQDIKFVLNSGDEIFLYKRIRQITPQEIDKLDSVIK